KLEKLKSRIFSNRGKMKIALIVACTEKSGGISVNGKLPWKLSGEFKYFMKVTKTVMDTTKKNVVVMGRKTWESIGTPLKGRVNIILTRNETYQATKNVKICKSLTEAMQNCKELGTIETLF